MRRAGCWQSFQLIACIRASRKLTRFAALPVGFTPRLLFSQRAPMFPSGSSVSHQPWKFCSWYRGGWDSTGLSHVNPAPQPFPSPSPQFWLPGERRFRPSLTQNPWGFANQRLTSRRSTGVWRSPRPSTIFCPAELTKWVQNEQAAAGGGALLLPLPQTARYEPGTPQRCSYSLMAPAGATHPVHPKAPVPGCPFSLGLFGGRHWSDNDPTSVLSPWVLPPSLSGLSTVPPDAQDHFVGLFICLLVAIQRRMRGRSSSQGPSSDVLGRKSCSSGLGHHEQKPPRPEDSLSQGIFSWRNRRAEKEPAGPWVGGGRLWAFCGSARIVPRWRGRRGGASAIQSPAPHHGSCRLRAKGKSPGTAAGVCPRSRDQKELGGRPLSFSIPRCWKAKGKAVVWGEREAMPPQDAEPG